MAIEMTKLVSFEDASFRRCEIMYEPSGIGITLGDAVAYYGVMVFVDER